MLDATVLSRIQFAFTAAAHIIFPAISIGVVVLLLCAEVAWLITKDDTYKTIYKFWAKIFAVSFGMGVVTGIPMALQFGTNWAKFSYFANPVVFTLMSVEVTTAFFLEAVFLGVMLFGWDRVSKKAHLAATVCVFLGTHNSAFWILVVNSWMHTPAGVEVVDGIMKVVDWKAVIFNPSMPYRVAHMVAASYLTAGFLVLGSSAYYLLSGKAPHVAKRTFSFVIWPLAVLSLAQPLIGDFHGLNTVHHQPAKVAAMEGLWETKAGIPALVFAIPDNEGERNLFEIGIPKLSSFLLTHDFDGVVKGLKDFPADERPKRITEVFYAFRIMVGAGLFFALLSFVFIGLKVLRRDAVNNRYFLWACIASFPLAMLALISGWVVTESGRQPWLVYNMMKVKDGLSPIAGHSVLISLIIFVVMYVFLYIFAAYYLAKVFRKGPLAA